jgi:hypothetical protein
MFCSPNKRSWTPIHGCVCRFICSIVPKVVDLDDNTQYVFDLLNEVGPVWSVLPHWGDRKMVSPAVD